jgi:hypothetical protein
MSATPSVGVDIPTGNRSEESVLAASSALAQSLSDLEVVILLDRPDEAPAGASRASG